MTGELRTAGIAWLGACQLLTLSWLIDKAQTWRARRRPSTSGRSASERVADLRDQAFAGH